MGEPASMPGQPAVVDMADITPNRRRGGDVRVLLSPATAGSTSGFLGVATVQPGEFISEHYHPYSEEFIFLARGSLTLRLDGHPVAMSAGQSVMVPRNVRHRLENHGSEAVFIVFQLSPLAPRPDLGHVDTERVPHPDEAHPPKGAPR